MTTCVSLGYGVIGMSTCAMGQLMPLHIWVTRDGVIRHVGPTLARISDGALMGAALDQAITVTRPKAATTVCDLHTLQNLRLKLRLSSVPDVIWTAMVVDLPTDGGALLNLSFGASIVDAVSRFDLTLNDFAPTELTAELLFLMEAKSAAFQQSRNLNERLESAKREAQAQALTDTLTGLHNRRAMERELNALTSPAVDQQFGIMHVDLDYFKAVNDTLGHAAGDHVLMHVAKVLRQETRKTDLVCRVGGDEFVLVLKDCDDLALLDKIAKRIIEVLEQPTFFDGQACRVSASIGTTVSSFYPDPKPDEMLSDADVATYASKNAGRSTHTVFDPENRDGSSWMN